MSTTMSKHFAILIASVLAGSFLLLLSCVGCTRGPSQPIQQMPTSPAKVTVKLSGTVSLKKTPDRPATADHFGTLVYLQEIPQDLVAPPPTEPLTVTWECTEYPSFSIGVQAGRQIIITWHDDEGHDFAISANNNPQPGRTRARDPREYRKVFRNPELGIGLKCVFHQCSGYVSVFPHQFFTGCSKQGNFNLPAVLYAGSYTLCAYDPILGSSSQAFTVSATGTTTQVNLKLEK